jgi:hypothetical protein
MKKVGLYYPELDSLRFLHLYSVVHEKVLKWHIQPFLIERTLGKVICRPIILGQLSAGL